MIKRLHIETPLAVFGLFTAVLLGVMLTMWLTSMARTRQIEQDMQELVDGYYECLDDTSRASTCYLEYDGDGGSSLPSEWHWYWK